MRNESFSPLYARPVAIPEIKGIIILTVIILLDFIV
mgnify:FL=1